MTGCRQSTHSGVSAWEAKRVARKTKNEATGRGGGGGEVEGNRSDGVVHSSTRG